MTTNIAKIRAALEMARDYITSDLASERGAFEGYEGVSRIGEIKADLANNDEALAALAELENAAAEPVAEVGGDFALYWAGTGPIQPLIVRHNIKAGSFLYAAPPAPVAEIREVVVTDEVAKRVMFAYHHNPVREDNAAHGRDMIAAVRAELGPTLGLVELKEPTPEECERIYSFWIGAEGCNGRTPGERMGRIMFDACRAVMCPKEGL